MSHAQARVLTGAVPATRLLRGDASKRANAAAVSRPRRGVVRVDAAIATPTATGKIVFDEKAKIDFGGHDRVETHGKDGAG